MQSTMKPSMRVFLVACLSTSVLPRAATTEMFPALRKHKHGKTTVLLDANAQPATDSVSAVVVPPPPDAGENGMPTLPELSDMMSGTSHALKTIAEQANALQQRAVEVQTADEAKLGKMKDLFESNLKKRELENLEVVSANAQISMEIDSLQKDNGERRAVARELTKASKFLRSELRALEDRLGAARDFATVSLKETDDTKALELAVLDMKQESQSTKEVATKKVETKQVDDDEDDEDSFVALHSRHHRLTRKAATTATVASDEFALVLNLADASPTDEQASATPADIVKSLTAGVSELAKQEQATEANAKALFAKDAKAEKVRHTALLKQQASLNATRASLQKEEKELKKAEGHLVATKSRIEAKLQTLGSFIQRLAHLALAPAAEAPTLLKSLPDSVELVASAVTSDAVDAGTSSDVTTP